MSAKRVYHLGDPFNMSDEQSVLPVIVATVVMSIAAYYIAIRSIVQAKGILQEKGIYGVDINKITPEGMDSFRKVRASKPVSAFPDEYKKLLIPESLGIVVGGVYLAVVIVLMLVLRVPLARYNAAICSIALMLLLGFVDDVLDVRWRHKIVLSLIATTPLLVAYDGATTMVIPKPFQELLGVTNVDLGLLYVVAMSLICVFCTNSINILAGVNGLEVGQSIVIGVSILVHNAIQLMGPNWRPHLISLVLCFPFVAVAAALFKFNKYPSKVFVGDSFTYFSGMTLAVAAITGHFTKTLMLFFIPQLLNFVISLPQLFGVVPCPRHRVPKWDSKADKLIPSYAKEGVINLTLLNVALKIFGPMREDQLTTVLIKFQVVGSVLGFIIRYLLAGLVYDIVE